MAKKHDIIWLESVDSTNEECRRLISDIDNLSVVAALSQISGRGQKGNLWISSPGENLTFSIVLKFPADDAAGGALGAGPGGLEPMHAYDQFVLSEIAALSVVDLLAGHGILAKIKWPNDIYADDRKICGILIENAVRGKWIQHSIIGIGLNVNQRNFDVTLPNPTSMVHCSDSLDNFDLRPVLEEFMEIFKAYLERYCHIRGGYGRIRKMYVSHLWRKDEAARFIDNTATASTESAGAFTGIIRGVSDNGLLTVEMPDGSLKDFSFKEITWLI